MLYDDKGIYVGDMALDKSEGISHYGTPRHSGRYPWGSGDNPYQRNTSFLGQIEKLRKEGLSEKQIADGMGIKTSELRKRKSLALAENRAYLVTEAKRLRDKGMSTSAVARRMGLKESTVRGYFDEGINERMSKVSKNANLLKKRVDELDYIDIGKGSADYMGIKEHSFNNAVRMLEEQGYTVHNLRVEQLGTGKMTTMKVLAKPGVEKKDVYKNIDKVKLVKDLYSEDEGETLRKKEPPVSIDSSRVMINYAEDGGINKDGVIELRRGVEDISLGNARYAQVRVMVDNSHYLKGMAVYADDLPDGVDIRFNTNKKRGTPMMDSDPDAKQVLKPIKKDLENPFGANIRDDDELVRAQKHYIGLDGKEHQSALNVVSEEGTWSTWNKTLASQFLSKQNPELAKQQLKLTLDIAKADMDEIASYTNPTVKAAMLEDFAGRCEHDSVHLAAAALPRQSTKVILPLTNTKDTEIYAPGYNDGEQVALVRYPHGGLFEIPILTVNNANKEAKSVIGDAIDAVGINKTVADRLSGADFDGDTVLVLPCNNVKIKGTANNRPSAYKSLEGFDAQELYKGYKGMHVMTSKEKGTEMGKATNLITDMTIKGATDEEICRATKYSMVVIDAEKHKLNYKQAYDDFGIAELKERYQGGVKAGASTFLSRSTSELHIPERKEKAFSKMTPDEKKRYLNGEQVWEYSGRSRGKPSPLMKDMTEQEKIDYKSGDKEKRRAVEQQMIKDGRMRWKSNDVTISVEKGLEMDPYSLVSGGSRNKTTRIEQIYADYATDMKEIARQARKLAREQEDIKYNPEANKRYSAEVASLDYKLTEARKNAPLERQAQRIANKKIATIFYNNPDMDDEHRKREKGRQLDAARKMVGAKKKTIGSKDNPLTEREWEAINAGAITPTKLKAILANSDKARIKQLALPKTRTGLSSAKLARAKNMLSKGYSRKDICDALDISETTLVNAIGIENI